MSPSRRVAARFSQQRARDRSSQACVTTLEGGRRFLAREFLDLPRLLTSSYMMVQALAARLQQRWLL
jgi:hypothetical protein